MARIERFEPDSKERQSVHGPVSCKYSTVRANDGRHLLQLDTFGSELRENPGKLSQSIQLDEAAARQLIDLLRATFPTLR